MRLIEKLGVSIQTHENKVACITKDDIGTNIDTLTDALHGIDAMYTYDSNVLLTMCYADCVPVYFYSTKHHFIALAHAGWRGTYTEIVKEVLKHVNFDLKDLHVVIGPSTSSSYEINDDIKINLKHCQLIVPTILKLEDEIVMVLI